MPLVRWQRSRGAGRAVRERVLVLARVLALVRGAVLGTSGSGLRGARPACRGLRVAADANAEA